MPGPRIAIIADDLSGALDAAAPFAAAGDVLVATGPGALGEVLGRHPRVVAVSTRSREIAAETARARVAEVLAAIPAGTRVIKKIDSRLKGNITAELAPFGARPLVVLPAIPEFGRIVRGGSVTGFGVERPIAVRAILDAPGAATIPDTATVAEMAAAVAAAPADAVLVGARGMTQALAGIMDIVPAALAPSLPRPGRIVVGSTDPITLAQVAALRAARPDLVYVPSPAGEVPAPPAGEPARFALLQAMPGVPGTPFEIAGRFAAGAAAWLRPARSMLLTGGATAEAVLDVLGVTCLEVLGEALSGMPCCRAGDQIVVTKSGGFGEADALVRLAADTG